MKKLQALFCALLVCTLLLSGLPRTASAAYPDRPVTIIIPFGPGGAVDLAARILAEYFQNKHQIPLNIVCKAGGAGAPATLHPAPQCATSSRLVSTYPPDSHAITPAPPACARN